MFNFPGRPTLVQSMSRMRFWTTSEVRPACSTFSNTAQMASPHVLTYTGRAEESLMDSATRPKNSRTNTGMKCSGQLENPTTSAKSMARISWGLW